MIKINSDVNKTKFLRPKTKITRPRPRPYDHWKQTKSLGGFNF